MISFSRIPSESVLGVNRIRAAGLRMLIGLTVLITFGHSVRAQVPVAEFTANNISGCAPLVVTFTDQSTGSPTVWNWGFSNGQLSSVQNPTVTFSQPGTYDVSLVVQNADGTHGITKTAYITVFPSPAPAFTADITTGCVPVTVQFTDKSNAQSGNITKWEWTFSDGTTSDQQNPQKTFNDVGFYNVGLKVTSSTGCTGARTIVRYIRIVPGVKAEFSNSNPVKCTAPFAVNFQNLTSGPGTLTYQWDLGTGTSTTENPSTTYNTAGTYNVKLVAKSEFGCTDSITKPVTITGYNTVINSPDTVCLNSTVSFQNGSTPAPVSSVWTFGNGVTSTHIDDTTRYTTPGDFQVKLVNTYGTCTDSVPKTITVLGPPPVDFTAPNVIGCQAPFTVNFQDISPDATAWQWNFGDGSTSTEQNPSHTYQDTGAFNVTLTITSSKGCSDSITKTAFVRITKPQIRFTNVPNGGCIPYNFKPAATVNTIDGVNSWFWDYGDGFTFTGQTPPTHTYNAVGSYNFTLRITTNGGCTETLTIPGGIKTGTPPVVNFSVNPTDDCASTTFSFTDLSTPPVDAWRWDFGDGSTSAERNPTHNFTDTGNFNVSLTAFNNRCPRTATAQVVHVKPPIADFDFHVQDCNNKRVVIFNDLSKTNAFYGTISYQWSFGDPVNSTSTTPGNTNFTYPGLGDYTVTLAVTNGSCTHSISKLVRLVGVAADFSVSKSKLCRGEQFTVSAIGSKPQDIARYEWKLDGGPFLPGTSSLATRFATTGNHTISLRITDINGCQDVMTKRVNVTGPTANFTATNPGGCSNSPITFNDLSTPAGSIDQWSWNFDDGNPPVVMTAAPFTHSFADTGTYTVRLTVRDTVGCTSTYTLPDSVIITRPMVGFTANNTIVCPGVNHYFRDTSRGNGLTYLWDFGDGNTSDLQDPVHIYTGPDSTYTVKLLITDIAGCKDSITRVDYISVRTPKPAFTVTDTTTICPPIETKFTLQGQDYASFYWDFGDGNTSTLPNPSNFYNAYGTYTATLYLTGYGGCVASLSTPVNVHNPFTTTSLSYSPLKACNELLVNFNISATPSTTWTFFFGDGPIDTTMSPTLSHLYTRPNRYTPAVLLKDNQDCEVRVNGGQVIEVIGAIPLFGKNKKAFCDTGTVAFTDYTLAVQDPVTGQVWDFGDNTTSNDPNPVHSYQQPGTYIVSHTVTTQQGCSNTLYDTVRVHGTPYARINGDSIACINEVIPLQGELVRSDTSITWTWNLANGGTSSDSTPNVSFGAPGLYTLSLITSNLLDCRDTAYKDVYVPPDPAITIKEDPVIVVGNGITLPITYSDSIATYAWTPATQLSCVDCPTPFANPQFTTTYKVSVENVYGCKASRDITVTVICNHENYFIPNTFSPNGDGMNDVFAPRGQSINRINSMKIFNRWGELIWEKRNFMANDRTPSGGWDGTYKGKPAQQDVYVYIIEFVCDNAQILPYKGNVTLIR